MRTRALNGCGNANHLLTKGIIGFGKIFGTLIISMDGFTVTELVTRAIKYFLEGLAVALATFIIPQKKLNVEEILAVAIVAAVTFALLDLLAPSIGLTARQGAGFGLGANLVGFPRL